MIEQLLQLMTATWDGNLVSKWDRDNLVKQGLACRAEGYNVITPEGISYLKNSDKLPKP